MIRIAPPAPLRRPFDRFRPSQPLSWRRVLLLRLPSLLVTLAVTLPLIYLAIRAIDGQSTALEALLRPQTAATLWRTAALAFSVTAAACALAVVLGWLTVRSDLPYRNVLAVFSALPLVIPSYVGAYLLVSALGPRGMLQQWLELLVGLERLPEIYGFPGAFLTLTLLSYPYVLLPVRAALLRMDPAFEESARSLGESEWGTFWRVTLPQLRPAIVAGGLLVALYTLRDFGAVSIMRYNTFTRVIYIQYQSLVDRSGAAALSLVLVVMTIALLFWEIRTRGEGRYYPTGQSTGKPLAPSTLGVWRLPAFILSFGVIALALLLPAGVLVFWLLRGIQAGQSISPIWEALRNSLLAAFLSGGVTVLAALPIVVGSVRYPDRIGRIFERIAYAGFALPGVVIALALVFFGARYAPSIYQTLPILIFAYTILFLPQAIGGLQSSLLQVRPHLEEAARSLGHSPWQVFRRVVFPLIRPGMAASFALVFLTTMKELPATLILGPFGFKTLATEVWGSVSEAFFARAAAPALLLIAASSIPMAYFVLRENKSAR